MPIVITPQGEYIDSVTGNPVGVPPQRPDIPRGGGAMSDQEMNMMAEASRFSSNIPSNMDMGLESMTMDMDAINKVRLLMDMGLNEQDALEAVVRERGMGTVRPEEFGGQQMQAPMPRPQTMGGQQMPQDQLGALPKMPPQAPPPRPDMSGMSREQMDMLRRGIDPFAEGMVK
jgi:hypothetical protein